MLKELNDFILKELNKSMDRVEERAEKNMQHVQSFHNNREMIKRIMLCDQAALSALNARLMDKDFLNNENSLEELKDVLTTLITNFMILNGEMYRMLFKDKEEGKL